MRKNLKNYTSSVSADRTIAQIEELVVKRMNARQFFKTYENGEVVGIIFVINTDKGDLGFKLPARVEQVEKLFYSQKKPRYSWKSNDPLSAAEKEQAKRTAWKNIHDWIDAQIALIETDQVKAEEVFLPYLSDPSGETLFQKLERTGYNIKQLGSGSDETDGVVIIDE